MDSGGKQGQGKDHLFHEKGVGLLASYRNDIPLNMQFLRPFQEPK